MSTFILALVTLATVTTALSGQAVAKSRPAKLATVRVHAPEGIVDKPKRPATMRVLDRRGKEDYAGPIGIELRGFTSLMLDPKKSYSVETRKNRDVSLLGLPAHDDWVLIASYKDETLLRNRVAYSAARWLGRYAARTRLVELTVNGSYEGVYLLAERLRLHGSRVAVDDSRITGGYLLEMVSTDRTGRGQEHFNTPVQDQPVVYKDPGRGDLSHRRAAWIRDYVGRFERRLYAPEAGDGERDYHRYLDMGAAVDFVLLNELFRNADTFRNSTYMYKGVGGKLVLGPIWDFDHALGNDPSDSDFNRLSGWQYQTRSNYRWVEQFYADPAFRSRMAKRWRDLRKQGLLQHLMRTIDRGARQLAGGPQRRNFSRWRIFGTDAAGPSDPRTGQPPADHAEAVDYLKWWLKRRAKSIDEEIDDR